MREIYKKIIDVIQSTDPPELYEQLRKLCTNLLKIKLGKPHDNAVWIIKAEIPRPGMIDVRVIKDPLTVIILHFDYAEIYTESISELCKYIKMQELKEKDRYLKRMLQELLQAIGEIDENLARLLI